MDTTKPTSGSIAIDASRFDAKNTIFFDRYRIIAGAFYELHFGFFGDSRDPQSGLIVVIPRRIIEETKASILEYFKQLGPMPDSGELPRCELRGEAEVVIADLLGLARHNETAEMIFHAFSWRVLVEKVRTENNKEPVVALCTALVRCNVALQKRWILDLYQEEILDLYEEGTPVQSKNP